MNDDIAQETHIILNWSGPFHVGKKEMALRPSPGAAEKDPTKVSDLEPGNYVYVILGDHPIYGSRALLYIGQSEIVNSRMEHHQDWLRDEWNVEAYLARVDGDQLKDVEKLLIRAHLPSYNSNHLNRITLTTHLRIWNGGTFWRLYPEISSRHPWFAEHVTVD